MRSPMSRTSVSFPPPSWRPPRARREWCGSVQGAERIAARVARRFTQLFLDAKELIVLRHSIGPTQRTGLDLSGASGYREVGDRHVLRLAGAMRDHRRVAGALGHADGIEGLAQRTDLVQLDEDRVG